MEWQVSTHWTGQDGHARLRSDGSTSGIVHHHASRAWEGQTCLSLECAEPATLKEAFYTALREDLIITKAYTKPSVAAVALPSEPEPMDIDVLDNRRFAYVARNQAPADECRAPTPTSAHAVDVYYEGTAPTARPKNGQDQ